MDKYKHELEQQRREVDYLYDKYDKRVGISAGYKSFAIISVDRNSFKSFKQAGAWAKHVERIALTANADPTKSNLNRVLIGDENFSAEDLLKEHLSCVKLRKNAALARSIVLTGSHQFQNKLLPQEKEKWINENVKYLKNKFGEDCIYAVLHEDETSLHIHAMISAVEYEEDKRKFFLRNGKYFRGREKLIELQDTYSEHLSKSFNCFIRGKRGSKAKHQSLKQFYNLMNQKINTNDLSKQDIENIVKDNYLLSKSYKEMRATYEAIDDNKEVKELLEEVSDLEKDNVVYKKVIRDLSDIYGIDREAIISLADKYSKENKKNKKKDRERKI